jgi:predicted transposase YdaD
MLEETFKEFERKVRQEARQEGRREGRREGRQEGREEGQQKARKEAQVEMQKLVLEMLRDRFGPVPQAARQRVKGISSLPELRKLTRRILTANSLQETGLL